MSNSVRPHGLQPTRLLHAWDFQARVLEWGAIAFSVSLIGVVLKREHITDEHRYWKGGIYTEGISHEDNTGNLRFHSCHVFLSLTLLIETFGNGSWLCPGFPGSSAVKESAFNAGDPGLIPWLGRSPGEGIGYPLQILAWRIPDCIVHGVTKSWTQLSDFHLHFHSSVRHN